MNGENGAIVGRLLVEIEAIAVVEEFAKAGFAVVVKDLEDAIRICNDFAPEHLSLVVKDERRRLERDGSLVRRGTAAPHRGGRSAPAGPLDRGHWHPLGRRRRGPGGPGSAAGRGHHIV